MHRTWGETCAAQGGPSPLQYHPLLSSQMAAMGDSKSGKLLSVSRTLAGKQRIRVESAHLCRHRDWHEDEGLWTRRATQSWTGDGSEIHLNQEESKASFL